MANYSTGSGLILVDLTTKVTNDREAVVNGALFTIEPKEGSSGTGLIQSFVRLQANGDQDGFNSSGRPLDPDVNTSLTFTHDLLLADVPIRTINGVQYYEFLLDINQTNSNPLVSLDELQIYTSVTAGLTTLPGGTPVYDLDGEGDVSVLLDYSLQSGSGVSDMYFYVPITDFAGDPNSTYVYLYSQFGTLGTLDSSDGGDVPSALYGTYSSNDGFEEWAVAKELPGVEFTGYKWHDLDGDSVWDGNEAALSGWRINYSIEWTITYKGNSKPSESGELTGLSVFTDENGQYTLTVPTFDDSTIASVSYTLTLYETLPDATEWYNTFGGYLNVDQLVNPTVINFTSADIDGKGSEVDRDGDEGVAELLNFGNTQYGSISGSKFVDADGLGGTTDDRDPYAGGWTIYLFNSDPNGNPAPTPVDMTTTDEFGNYSFDMLPPGTYWVVEGTDSEWFAVSATQVSVGTVQSGFDVDNVNFVNTQYGSISGTKFVDADGLGGTTDDRDPYAGGWTIYLFDSDPSADPPPAHIDSMVTDEFGNYSFTGLAPGTYWVAEGDEEGWFAVSATQVEVGPTESGFVVEDIDFANTQYGSISGTKFVDADGLGGTTDDRDPYAGGWTIYLFDSDPSADPPPAHIDSMVTDEFGNYSFTGLAPGTYWVAEGDEEGWFAVSATQVEVGPTESGFVVEDIDFANTQYGSISGTKFVDADGLGGTTDDRDPYAGGWTIYLFDSDPSADPPPAHIDSMVTDEFGNYSFTGLAPGTYWVAEGDEEGWYPVTAAQVEVGPTESGFVVEDVDFANFLADPSIDIEKSVRTNLFDYLPEDPPELSDDDPDGLLAGTDTTVTFRLVVTNTGNESLSNITLTDSVVHNVNGALSANTIVYTPDGDATTIDAQNVFVDLDYDGAFDAGEEWANFDTDGDGTIDAGAIATLAPGESFTLYYDLTSAVGQHENTGSVSATSAISASSVGDADDANYYVLPSEDCVGVGTPGFWGHNGFVFWDGNPDNQSKHAGQPGFADGELLDVANTNGTVDSDGDGIISTTADVGLLLGDYDGDGMGGDGTIFIPLDVAQMLIDASNRHLNGKQADGVWILGRDSVASWLNFLANGGEDGGCFGTGEDENYDPTDAMNDAIEWLLQYADANGDGILSMDEIGGADGRDGDQIFGTKSAEWKDGGAEAHAALDEYNNFGIIDGVVYCCDRDDHEAMEAVRQVNSYVSTEEEGIILYMDPNMQPDLTMQPVA